METNEAVNKDGEDVIQICNLKTGGILCANTSALYLRYDERGRTHLDVFYGQGSAGSRTICSTDEHGMQEGLGHRHPTPGRLTFSFLYTMQTPRKISIVVEGQIQPV